MLINSNDIFSQIGLVVDPNKKSNYNTKPKYVICLEIQLNEDQKYILEVKDFDDPNAKANQFCSKHRLNKLAVQIVQAKIRQAMENEQQKIMKNKMRSTNNNTKQKKTEKPQINNSKYQSKNLNPNQKAQSPDKAKKSNKASPQKSRKRQNQNNQSKSISKSKSKPKLSKNSSTDNIYLRSMIKSRMLQERRNKMKVQIQKKQEQQLTFKPVINNVSEKIVQFLKTNNIPKSKKEQPPKKMYDQMKQCTFKPKINKVSQIIVNNKSIIKQQRENHKNLFNEQNSQQSNKKSADQQYPFKPQINPKSSQKITMPFFKRLQIAHEKKVQATTRQKFYDQQQCSFKPKINRGPLKDRSKQHENIWEYLHNYNRKQTHLCPVDNSFTLGKQTSTSQQYYQNLIQDRINSVFTILDSNNDGLISPNQIAIQQLPTESLHFLKPIFLEMDQIDATLNRYQFKKAVLCLMNDSDPGSKGAFIASKWKKQVYQKQKFQPNINKRSKQLASNRSVENLYKQGLREKQNKQYRLQKQRALREQKQLMECSFKPVLNHSSKLYIDKVVKKKGDFQQNKHNKSSNEMKHSFGRSQDDGLF